MQANKALLLSNMLSSTISVENADIASFETSCVTPLDITVDIDPVQDLHGYDNPWPAGGGKNLFEAEVSSSTTAGITITANGDGTFTFNGTATALFDFYFTNKQQSLANGTYLINGITNGSNSTYRLYAALSGNTNRYVGTNTGDAEVTLSNETIRLFLRIYNGATLNNVVIKPMIRLASVSDATFAPYSNICPISGRTSATIYHSGADTSDPETFTIQLGQTVYGGTLNVTNGELVVDKAIVTFDGSSDESWTVDSLKRAYTQINAIKKEINYSQSMKCDKLRLVSNHVTVSNTDYSISGYGDNNGNYPNQNWVYLKLTDAYDSVASIREWLTANPVTIVYTLATPITLTLDPVEIRSLLGDNNVWSDTGNVSVRNIACNADVLELLLKTKLIGDC